MPKLCPEARLEDALEQVLYDPEEALDTFAGLVRRYPKDPRLRYNHGVLLMQLGRSAQALDELAWSAPRLDDPQGYRGLARAYAELDMPIHALAAARRIPGDEGAALARDLTNDLPPDMTEKDQLAFEQARLDILYRHDPKGREAMKRFLGRFPDYRPALNIAAQAAADALALEEARRYAEQALALSPRNPHSLFVLARVTLLTEGPDETRAFIAEHAASRNRRKDPVPDEALARAQLWALVGDDLQVERALRSWDKSVLRRREHPVAGWLQAALETRAEAEAGERPPFFGLLQLLSPQVIKRWALGHPKALHQRVAADLSRLPGLLALLPEQLGFEDAPLAALIATTLIEEPLDAPHGSWPEVLKAIVQDGPGILETRLSLAGILKDRGLADSAELRPDGLEFLQLEIRTNPEPAPFGKADERRFAEALDDLRAGRYAAARGRLAPLAERYPDFPSVLFNLAIAEVAGDAPEAGQARLERLVAEHPDYLFAKAQLAVQALQRNDLARARELLALPQGLTSVHVQEYATFIAAQGMLAAREGEVERAERHLDLLEELGEDDSSFYRELERNVLMARLSTSLLGGKKAER